MLVREGVEIVFGYPGGAIMPAYDSMLQYPIHHVLVRHEQGAAHAAEGFARASGKVGVAIATSGPGATNLITGIADAMLDSTPLVCITGQISSHLLGTDGFQEVDFTGITLPVTKHNYLVTKVEELAETLREAFFIARSGRPGPVVVDITKDAQQSSCTFVLDEMPIRRRGYRPVLQANTSGIDVAVQMIAASKRPLILAGQGIIQSGASDLLHQYVDASQIPVACTLLGLGGLSSTHPMNLGLMGMHGEAWVNHAIQEADLLIAMGMRFDDRVTGNLARFAPNAKKIHIELDPAEINKNVKVDLALLGDVKDYLGRLLTRVTRHEHPEWRQRLASLTGDAAVRDIQSLPDNGKLYAAHVIHDLWRITGGDALIVTDVGQHQMWAAQYFKHSQPRKFLTSGGLGTMGFGLPAAMGARFACPDDDIWVIVGDGGVQMTSCELATLAQEGAKLNIAIINNGYLGMVRQWQEFFYESRYVSTPITAPDFVKLAEAYGHTGLRVKSRSEVRNAVETARITPGTVVIDFCVEQEDSVYPMVPAGAALDDMIRRPLSKAAVPQPMLETGDDP